MDSRSTTSHARQPALTSLVESELAPPVPPLYRSCQKIDQKQCVVVSRNVGGMTLGDAAESNGIFRGSIVMRGAIETDGLTDSETRIACLDSAVQMNFMNSKSGGISAILMQNFLAGSMSSGSSDHGRQRVHIVASQMEDITNKPAHTTAGNVPN